MESDFCFLGKHDTAHNEFTKHTHTCYEIIFILSGCGKIMIGDKNYSFSPRTYCVVAPGTQHTEMFDGDGSVMFFGFKYSNKNGELCSGVFKNADADTVTLFHKIFDEYKNQQSGYQDAIKAFLDLLIVFTLRKSSTEAKQCKDLDYIKTYIGQYYYQKINFRDLSELSGYSYDYFRSIFRKKFGVSPQTYMINIRLEQAKKLLFETDIPCTEVAYKCGFSNSGQFSAMYKKKFGVSPSKNRFI